MKSREEKKPAPHEPEILDHFSAEQFAQICRLTRTGDFAGSEHETVAALAEAALYVFGLDPLAEEAFCRLSEVVFGANSTVPQGIHDAVLNEVRSAANAWTREKRQAEREAALKGRAA